jgi:hypothetical protein
MQSSRTWLIVIAVVFLLGTALGFSIRPSVDAKMNEDNQENVRLTMAAQSVYDVKIEEGETAQFFITCEGCIVTINHEHNDSSCDKVAISHNGTAYAQDFFTISNGSGSWTVFLNTCSGTNSATFTVFFPSGGSIVRY